MADQREARRKSVRGIGNMRFQPSYDVEIRMLDVSTKGLGVVAAINIPPGSSGLVRFPVPGPDARPLWYEVKATVVDCVLSGGEQGFRIGLRFTDNMPGAARLAIEVYING